MEKYSLGIFFDNEERHINKMFGVCRQCRDIKCVKVNSSDRLQLLPWTTDPLLSYTQKFSGTNTYLNVASKIGDWINGDMYDSTSGIQDDEIRILHEWIATTDPRAKRVAIFDWDRTITFFEGVLLPPFSLSNFDNWVTQKTQLVLPSIKTEDILEYILGGKERLDKIRTEVFKKCFDNGIDIVILTNNEMALPTFRTHNSFKDLLNSLFLIDSTNIPYTLECSSGFEGKGVKLSTIDRFKDLCVAPGGGRGKRYRKSHQRKSKKNYRRKSKKRHQTHKKINKK